MQDYNSITEELRPFYDKIKQYSSHQNLSTIWIMNTVQSLDEIIAGADPFDSKLKKIHDHVHYSLMHQPEVRHYQTLWWLKYLAGAGCPIDSLPPDISEADVVHDSFKTRLDSGRFVSPDLMRRIAHLNTISEKYQFAKDQRIKALELGAGTGALARTFMLFYPRSTYYIIDIPVTLYFSAGFLRSSFPDRKILLVGSEEEFKAADRDAYDFVLVPVGLDHLLYGESFDLFLNTHSMGEMPNHMIERWFDLIQNRLDVKRVFMVNRFLNRLQTEARRNENKGSVLFDPHWDIVHWEFEPPFMRCPFAETVENQCALVMAERIPPERRDPAAYHRMSDELADYVSHQDWVRKTNNFNPFLSNQRPFIYPERYQDYTMDGTLFHLWNSIRLHPTVTNTSLMVQYLKYINMLGENFEELDFFFRLNFQSAAAAAGS